MPAIRACRFVFVVGALGVGFAPAVSRADVISDEEAVCRDKSKGDRCEVGGTAGACQTSTCSRNDYSDGPPPKQVSVECLLCVPGAAPEQGDTGSASDTPTKTRAKTDAKTDPAAPDPEPKKGGCAVVGSSSSGLGFGFGAMILVGGFATRRSRRRGIDRA